MEPAGAGLLALAFEELKRKLAAEGLFAPERKRPLPFLPRRIGVVTSQSGAVLRDIIRVAHRRAAVPLLLSPTPVQGEGAARRSSPRCGGGRGPRRRRGDRRPRRRLAGGPVVLQRRGAGPGHRRLPGAGDLGGGARDRLHHRRLRRRPAGAHAVGGGGDRRAGGGRPARASWRCCSGGWRAGCLGDIRNCTLALERARARLGDPRRLVDERRQLLDDLAGARGARPAHGAGPPAAGAAGRGGAAVPGPPAAAYRRAARAPCRPWSTGWSAPAGRADRSGAGCSTACWASWRRCRRWRCWIAGTAWPGGQTATSSPSGPSCARAMPVQLRFRDGEVSTRVEGDRRRPATTPARSAPVIRGAVLGGDVSRSRSPGIHAAAFRALGKAGRYDAFSRRRRRVRARWCGGWATRGTTT